MMISSLFQLMAKVGRENAEISGDEDEDEDEEVAGDAAEDEDED